MKTRKRSDPLKTHPSNVMTAAGEAQHRARHARDAAASERAEPHRRGEEGEGRRSQEEEVGGPLHEPEVARSAQEDEGELPDLRHGDADGQRGAVAVAERPHDESHERCLRSDDDDEGHQENVEVLPEEPRVHEEAYRREEERREERSDALYGVEELLGVDWVPGHHHPGDECAELEREAEAVRRPGDGQAEGDADDEVQLLAAAVRPAEDGPDELLGEDGAAGEEEGH